MKSVLVSGGAGFIGSHLVDAYLERGWKVTVVDSLRTGRRENLDRAAEFVEGDITDRAVLDGLAGRRFDLISHHAAQLDVRFSVADPAEDAQINIVGSLRVFQFALETSVPRLIFASSGGVIYGDPQIIPQPENHPLEPRSPYGCAKLSVEHYLNYLRVVRGISSVALRYANVYGPRQRAEGEGGVVAIFARQLFRNERVMINGSGLQTRDYIHVSDVVAANMAASENAIDGAFNVGTGKETTVVGLFDAMKSITGSSLVPDHGPAKLGEQMRSVLDGRKLRELVSLPAPVNLDDGLRETLEWFRLQV